MVANDMRETNRVFEEEVVGKGDFGALRRVYTKGARIMPPGAELITGAENIAGFWKQAAAAMGIQSVKLYTVEFEELGDSVFEIGRAELFTGPAGPPVTVKYVVLWKQEDGFWKWHVDIWNPNS